MLASFMTVSAVIVTPGESTNSVGDPIIDWEEPAGEFKAKCWMEPLSTGEDVDLRDKEVERFRLFFEKHVVIPATARIQADGLVLEVEGPPQVRRTVRGPHHVEVRCKSVVG